MPNNTYLAYADAASSGPQRLFDLQALCLGIVDFSGEGRQSFSYVPADDVPKQQNKSKTNVELEWNGITNCGDWVGISDLDFSSQRGSYC